MKKLFIIIAVLLLPCWVGAETYFLRADGSGSKVDATGSGTGACGAAGTAMSIATHDGETYAAGDTIYLCDDGGVYRDELDVPSSGSNGSPITYTEASGDTPKISGADIVSTWTGVATEETEGAWSSGDADLSSADWNFRMTVAAADIDNDGNSIVLRLEAHSTEDVTVVGAFIGEKASSGDAYDMESGTIEEFLWSSGSGTTVSAGTTSDSDSLTFSYDESKDYIISIGLNDLCHGYFWNLFQVRRRGIEQRGNSECNRLYRTKFPCLRRS
jgi:hypothetical protein